MQALIFLLSVSLTQANYLKVADFALTYVVNSTNGSSKSVPFHIYSPLPLGVKVNSPCNKLPVVLLINGARVESNWYTSLSEQLGRAGLWVATSDLRRPFIFNLPPNPGCPAESVIASAGLVTTVMKAPLADAGNVTEHEAKILQRYRETAYQNGMLLLGHSLGGNYALAVLAGHCGETNKDALLEQTCQAYEPVLDSQGNNILKGALLYEGYYTPYNPGPLPQGTSILYMQGRFDTDTGRAYGNTTADCVAFAQIDGNHYGLCDYVPNVNGTQITPCAVKALEDPSTYEVTPEKQAKLVKLTGKHMELFVKARFSATAQKRDAAAEAYQKLLKQQYVLGQVDKGCF